MGNGSTFPYQLLKVISPRRDAGARSPAGGGFRRKVVDVSR